MIGSRFLRYLKSVPPRPMSRLQLFTRFLKHKVDDGMKRALHLTPNSHGARVMMEIIKLADLETLLLPGDPYRRTGVNLLPILKDLEKPIDLRNGRHTPRSMFIKSKTHCFEMICPSRRTNPIGEIPFDLPYDDPAWAAIRPFRVSDMGTTDLRFSVHSGYLQYQRMGPTHAIYSLDCLALVSKFVAYYRAQERVENLDQTLLDFIHYEVIVPSLLNDSLAIWMRNTYRQQLLIASPLESHVSTVWDVITTDTIGTDFAGAMADVLHLKRDLTHQSIGALTALSSLPLTVDGQSFADYYRDLFTTAGTPDLQPFIWVDCLKNIAWWEFIIMVTSFTPDHPDAMAFRRDVIRDIRFWLMLKPWSEIHGSLPFRTMVRHRLEGLYAYLKATS